jgi:hypothetical protein
MHGAIHAVLSPSSHSSLTSTRGLWRSAASLNRYRGSNRGASKGERALRCKPVLFQLDWIGCVYQKAGRLVSCQCACLGMQERTVVRAPHGARINIVHLETCKQWLLGGWVGGWVANQPTNRPSDSLTLPYKPVAVTLRLPTKTEQLPGCAPRCLWTLARPPQT